MARASPRPAACLSSVTTDWVVARLPAERMAITRLPGCGDQSQLGDLLHLVDAGVGARVRRQHQAAGQHHPEAIGQDRTPLACGQSSIQTKAVGATVLRAEAWTASMDLADIAATVLRDMQPASGPRPGRRLHPGAGPRRSAAFRPGDRHLRRARSRQRATRTSAFSVQSISKVFTLTMALEKLGSDLWERVGREPSGSRVQLHRPARARKGHAAQSADQRRRAGGRRRVAGRRRSGGDDRGDHRLHAPRGGRSRRRHRRRRWRRPKATDRLPQRQPRQFPARRWQSAQRGGGRAAGLFQPVRAPP